MLIQPFLAISTVILSGTLSIALYNLRTKGHRRLSFLLLIYGSFSLLRWGLLTENYFILVYAPLIIFPVILLFGTTILLYSEKVLFNDESRKIKKYLIGPVLISLAHLSLIVLVPEQMTPAQIKNQEGIHKAYTIAMGSIMVIYNLPFCLIAYSRIMKYKKKFQDNFSNDTIKNVQWLLYFVGVNIGNLSVMGIVMVYCIIHDLGVPFTIVEEIYYLGVMLFFVYYLITKPEILPIKRNGEEETDSKYAKVKLPGETRRQYAKLLDDYIQQNQAFLEEDISVPRISKELDIPQHHLSMTINVEFKQNFYSYVNGHRIRYAEKLLEDPEEKEETILDVAYRSGFQSKTSFNKAFKFLNYVTPSVYRRIYFEEIEHNKYLQKKIS